MKETQKRLMSDIFEIKGIWYLPGQDMEKEGIPGVLKYSPNEIILELIGKLYGEKVCFSMEQEPKKKIIYGFSDGGENFYPIRLLCLK